MWRGLGFDFSQGEWNIYELIWSTYMEGDTREACVTCLTRCHIQLERVGDSQGVREPLLMGGCGTRVREIEVLECGGRWRTWRSWIEKEETSDDLGTSLPVEESELVSPEDNLEEIRRAPGRRGAAPVTP